MTSVARHMWELVERYHAAFYLAPEPRDTAKEAGLKGFWMTYFASRAAPMGPVQPEVVDATFFYFSPSRVRRALPDAWRFATPEAVLAARYEGVDRVLRRLYGDAVTSPALAEAAALAREAVSAGSTVGRPLFASWAGLAWPEPAHLALWHAATVLREHRSGGHAMALACAGLDGCESVVSHVAVDGAPRDWITGEAGWTPQEAAAAADRLRQRGWVDPTGRATERGRAGRLEVERLTDELDAGPWAHLGASGIARLEQLLEPIVAALPPDDQLDWESHYGPN
jgi:hypothetical protein